MQGVTWLKNFTLVSLILNCIFDKKLAVFHLNNDIVVYLWLNICCIYKHFTAN